MAEYQGIGDAASNLMEECAEVIQVIAKLKRFGGNWDEIPPGKTKTRWQMLDEEMYDLILAWKKLKEERGISDEEPIDPWVCTGCGRDVDICCCMDYPF